MRRRRNSGINLAAGFALVALSALAAMRFSIEAVAMYPREGAILLGSIALGFIIALARKWKGL